MGILTFSFKIIQIPHPWDKIIGQNVHPAASEGGKMSFVRSKSLLLGTSHIYLPTFSEISAWAFYPGSAGIFEDDTIISEDSRRIPKSSEEVRSLPKTSEVFQICILRLTKAKTALAFPSPSLRTRINASPLPVLFTRKVSSFIHFTHGFRSLHGSKLTYFWKLCQARRQQLTFFNQACEIDPQAWAGVRSKFSTRRRETHA